MARLTAEAAGRTQRGGDAVAWTAGSVITG